MGYLNKHALNGLLTGLLCLILVQTGLAQTHQGTVEQLLAQKEEPAGVIFEIVTSDSESLEWALPLVKGYIARLRARFPELDVAIVTHGREQFALAKDKADSKQKVHSLTQQLHKDGVQLHVCGTYASRKGMSAEDFPEYVNVSETGPAQVNDYLSVGYTLVKIKRKK